jgi:hypothetical protein
MWKKLVVIQSEVIARHLRVGTHKEHPIAGVPVEIRTGFLSNTS